MERSLAVAKPQEQQVTAAQQPATALAPNQAASLLSLLCMIAGSVLASSSGQDTATDDRSLHLQLAAKSAASPDPPVLVPDGDAQRSVALPLLSTSGGPGENGDQVATKPKPAPQTSVEASREAASFCVQCEGCAKKQKAEQQANPAKFSANGSGSSTATDVAKTTPASQTPAGQDKSVKETAVACAEKAVEANENACEGDAASREAGKTEVVGQSSESAVQSRTKETAAPNEIPKIEPLEKDKKDVSDSASKDSEHDQSSAKPASDGDGDGARDGAAAQTAVVQESSGNSENATPQASEAVQTETAATDKGAKTEIAATEETKATETVAELKLPEWFLGNNVVLYEDLVEQPSCLELVVKTKPTAKEDSKTDQSTAEKVGNDGDEKAAKIIKSSEDPGSAQTAAVPPSSSSSSPVVNSQGSETKDQNAVCKCNKTGERMAGDSSSQMPRPQVVMVEPDTAQPVKKPPTFQLDREMYQEALDLISTPLQPLQIKAKPDGTRVAPPRDWVTTSTFLFQSPKEGSLGFLDEVMRQLGKDSKADMITVDLEDMEDLCHHFWKDSDEVRNVSPMELTSTTRLVNQFFGYQTPEENSKKAVASILNAAMAKQESVCKPEGSESSNTAAATDKGTRQSGPVSQAGSGAKQSLEANALAVEILQAGVKNAFESATLIMQAAIAEAFARALAPGSGMQDATCSNGSVAKTTNKSEALFSTGGGPGQKVQVQVQAQAQAQAQASDASDASDASKESPTTNTTCSAEQRPLIIVFRGVDSMGKMTPLQRLANGINDARRDQERPIILIGTAVSNSSTDNRPTEGISKAWDGLEIYESCIVNLAPRNTRRAAEALRESGAKMKPSAKWRLLRRSVRVTLDHHPSVDTAALYPSGPPAGEKVVDEIEDKGRRQMLADWDDRLSERVVRQVSARAVKNGAVDPSDIFDVMQRVLRNKAVFEKMNEAGDDEFVSEDGDNEEESVEINGPIKKSKVKPLLDSIAGTCSDAEKEYFDCVVDTEAVSSEAQDIHMDQSLMDSLQQLLDLRQSKPYGLLAREAVNGAILYGPPGTGKTHLARVVTASAGTNLIVATPADFQNMWVGETEKRIKALFSLGTKLAPCVIFLDEGDSVFGKRSSQDHDWQRKAMSQFLMEMDGLVSRKKAPFLMVATNRPGDIDDAVCRRLPHSLHIGMPTAAGRRAILEIYLKDEKLDAALDLEHLASDKMTKGFSGSDIRTLCVQAAMVAHKELVAERRKQGAEAADHADVAKASEKRVITWEHFKKALERTRPSVTRESLLEIERFTGQNEQGDHQAMYI